MIVDLLAHAVTVRLKDSYQVRYLVVSSSNEKRVHPQTLICARWGFLPSSQSKEKEYESIWADSSLSH